MSKLIITTTDSGAGCVKMAKLADRVVCITHDLVSAPVPATANSSAFLAVQRGMYESDAENYEWWIGSTPPEPNGYWPNLIDACTAFDTLELWIDPSANAQLILLQVLESLAVHPHLTERLAIVYPPKPLGDYHPEDIATAGLIGKEPGTAQAKIAARAWSAYVQSSPEGWAELLQMDMDCLPVLRPLVLRMLEELPDVATALSRSEADILAFICGREINVLRVLSHQGENCFRVLGYWALGRTLDVLAQQAAPAISGLLEGPFSNALHDDRVRHDNYNRSNLNLTGLGERLVKAQDDFSRTAKICRWWGGTRLSNDNLWRWNRQTRELIAPS